MYAQLLNTEATTSPLGTVPEGTTPNQLLANPDLLNTPTGTTPAPWPAPNNVHTTLDTYTLTVTWDHPGPVTQYTVTAHPTTGPDVTTTTTNTTATVPLNGSATYQVTVTAEHTDGRTATSTPVTVTTDPNTPDVTLTHVNGLNYRATWAPVPDATSYTVSSHVGDNNWSAAEVTTTQMTYTLEPGHTLHVRIQAHSPTGTSPWSPEVTITVPPAPPVELTATRTGRTITLNWPTADGATSYRLTHTIGDR